MEEFKGTKGRWYLQEFTDGYTNIIRCDAGKGFETKWIGATSQCANPSERANAQLMAASPDLLKACQSFIELFKDSDMRPEDECNELFDKMIEAVGKALDSQPLDGPL